MRGTTNRPAFRAYLEGERLFTVVSQDQMAMCLARFERATQLDSKFARAWGWRSYATARSVLQGWVPNAKAALRDAETWAKKAVKLDPYDYAPLWDLAFVYLNTGRFQIAIATYERAHKLYNEGTDRLDRKPGLLVEMAEAYVHVGDPKKGIALLQRAMRFPDWYAWNLGWAYFNARDYKNALDVLLKIDLSPKNPQYVPEVRLFIAATHYRYSLRLARQKRQKEATAHRNRGKAAMAKFLKIHPQYTLDDAIAARSRLKNLKDEKHWAGALKGLGLK
jgi:tetratricopeptide (TPR) repeat protein